MRTVTLLYTPFTGLGNYNGFRGNCWLKNRIQIFKQFTLASLLSQTNRDFVHWISWRHEERNNPLVKELEEYLNKIDNYKFIFTFSGVCFWDDKYPDEIARDRLLTSLHGSTGELLGTNILDSCDYVLMVLTPSDDCYSSVMVDVVQKSFNQLPLLRCIGFAKGYMMNYITKELAEYNPNTNPPFVTIKFPRDVFIDPTKHAKYTAIKKDIGEYNVGTPCPSHEYYPDVFGENFGRINERGFLVGTHGSNISTVFNHPFKGDSLDKEQSVLVLRNFGLSDVKQLVVGFSPMRIVFDALPYLVKRKLRYWSEKKWILRPLFAIIYNILRS